MLAITGNEKRHGHPVLLSGILWVIGLIAMLMIVREGLERAKKDDGSRINPFLRNDVSESHT